MCLSTEQYFSQHLSGHESELTDEIRNNAADLVEKQNKLIDALIQDDVQLKLNPATGTLYTSGWRPASVNASIPGAAVFSNHMTGNAGDLYDPHGEIDDWCMAHQNFLASIGLWLEHPAATKGWSHTQRVAPRSGNRVFYP